MAHASMRILNMNMGGTSITSEVTGYSMALIKGQYIGLKLVGICISLVGKTS